MNKKKAQLFAKIMKCKTEIDNLKPNIEKCESAMALFNKKIIEKAVLTKELKDFDDNFVIKIVRKFVPNQERAICDYFAKS